MNKKGTYEGGISIGPIGISFIVYFLLTIVLVLGINLYMDTYFQKDNDFITTLEFNAIEKCLRFEDKLHYIDINKFNKETLDKCTKDANIRVNLYDITQNKKLEYVKNNGAYEQIAHPVVIVNKEEILQGVLEVGYQK